jgi:hypothetical protein
MSSPSSSSAAGVATVGSLLIPRFPELVRRCVDRAAASLVMPVRAGAYMHLYKGKIRRSGADRLPGRINTKSLQIG